MMPARILYPAGRPRRFAALATRGAAVFVFAFACCAPSKAQQGESPAVSSPGESLAEHQWSSPLAPAETSSLDLPDAPNRQPLQARRMTLGERIEVYRRSILNPDSVLSPALGAALAQANNEPPEWGQGADGYGTRLASGYGRLVINRTIRFGVAALDHEDPRFIPTNERGFWRRFRRSSVDYVMPRT